MEVPQVISDVAAEVRAKIAARDAEIAHLKKSLEDLESQRESEHNKLIELEEAFPELKEDIGPEK